MLERWKVSENVSALHQPTKTSLPSRLSNWTVPCANVLSQKPPIASSTSSIQLGDATCAFPASAAYVTPSPETSNFTVPLASEIRHHRCFARSYGALFLVVVLLLLCFLAFCLLWCCVF